MSVITNGRYKPSGNQVVRIVEAVDSYSHRQVLATLEDQLTEAYQTGLGARELPEEVCHVLLTAWGAYEALEVALKDQLQEVLPGFRRCREQLRRVLAQAGVSHV